MELLKLTEYQLNSFSNWNVTDPRPFWKWRYVPNMLKLNTGEYIKLLRKFNAVDIRYYAPTDCLLYSFKTKDEAHKWALYINRKARELNYRW